MTEMWTTATDWFWGLGDQYGVNPILFGSIYVGAIPLFTLSIAWLIKAKRERKSLLWPTLSAGFWFVSSYLYLFIAGTNIPWWVYATVIGLVAYAAIATFQKIRTKLDNSQ